MNPARLKAYLLLLIVAAIWGVAGPVIKFTLGGIEPLLFLTYRFAISALVALPFFIISGLHLPKDRGTFLTLILYGVLTTPVSLGLLFFGLENSTVLDLTLITIAAPLLVTLLGVIFLREHITNQEKIGMTIVFIGTIFATFEPIIQNGASSSRLSGNFLLLAYLFASTFPAVLAKKLLRADVDPLVMTNLSFIIGFIALLPLLLLTNTPTSFLTTIYQLPIPYHLGVFYMALLSGSLAYYLGNRAQKTIEISEAALFSYLYPIFATPLAVFWLGEKITIPFITGAVIIALGVVITEYKRSKLKV